MTLEGLEEIRKIKSGMNNRRDYEKLDDPSNLVIADPARDKPV